MDVEARFWELCDEAIRLDELHWSDCRGHEPPMVEIIGLVERHPEHREAFVRCFAEIVLWRRPAPWFLAAFCMRRLRLPEIRELVRRDAEAHEGTAYYADRMNYWSTVMHAYHDAVWEAAGLWPYYSHELRARAPHDAEPDAEPDRRGV